MQDFRKRGPANKKKGDRRELKKKGDRRIKKKGTARIKKKRGPGIKIKRGPSCKNNVFTAEALYRKQLEKSAQLKDKPLLVIGMIGMNHPNELCFHPNGQAAWDEPLGPIG